MQRQVIPALLETSLTGFHIGRAGYRPSDLCVSAPTGSGKTLAFVLPIIQVCNKQSVYLMVKFSLCSEIQVLVESITICLLCFYIIFFLINVVEFNLQYLINTVSFEIAFSSFKKLVPSALILKLLISNYDLSSN